MKILQVIPSLALGFGGPSIAVIELSRELVNQGQDVTIFTTDADIKGKLKVNLNTPVNIDGVKVFYFPVHFLQSYKFSLPLAKALRKNIPYFDIVHIHSLFQFSTLVAAFYCRRYHKPYIIEPLGQLDPFLLKRRLLRKRLYLRFFELRNLESSQVLHLTSEEEKNWCENLGLKVRSIIIPLGVNLEEFQNLPSYGTFRSKYPELKNKKIILFLSRISFKKGLDILVEAFGILANGRDDLHLIIAGPDNEGYGKNVKSWLKKKGLLNRTTFTGMLLGKDKLAAFRDSDIFVLPSYSENFGLSALEAMACGVPVVISNKVGIWRDVEKNKAGVVVETNPESLLKGIKRLLDDEDLRMEIIDVGKRLVQENYNIEKIAGAMIKIYKKILNGAI